MSKTINNNQQQTLIKLNDLGLLNNDDIDKVANSEEGSPWFINLFFGFTGILSSLFFIGFLSLLLFEFSFFESFIGLVVVGTLLSAAGWVLFSNARTRHSPFWNSLAFAITLAGQMYIGFALLFEGYDPPISVLLLLLVQLIVTIVMPNFIYRLLSATVALGCIVYLSSYYGFSEMSLALLALIAIVAQLQRYSIMQRLPSRWRANFAEMLSAIGYASAFVLLSVSVYFIAAEYGYGRGGYQETITYNYYLAQGLLTLASLYAVYLIIKRYEISLLSATGLIIVGATAVLGIMSIYVSGLLATSLIIIIAFANSQRVLLGFGILALVSYIFWYYYQLDTSLLLKSASMLIIGVGLMLIRWLLIKRYFKSNATLLPSAGKERLL